jgi:competence ComEA-like helix-hairpin-helix protein
VQKVSPYLVFDSKSTQNTFGQNNSSKREYPTSQWVDLNNVTAIKLAEFDITGWKSDSLIYWQSKYWFTQKVNVVQLKDANSLSFSSLILQYASLKKQPVDLSDNYSIELNQADTAELNVLDGIGPVLARRIVYYRKQLGGFYSFEQLQEVTGISPATMQKVKTHVTVNTQLITPININNASLRRLKEHPYLGYFKAKDIIEYRKAKGKINSLDEIVQLSSFNGQQADWIRYYLTL